MRLGVCTLDIETLILCHSSKKRINVKDKFMVWITDRFLVSKEFQFISTKVIWKMHHTYKHQMYINLMYRCFGRPTAHNEWLYMFDYWNNIRIFEGRIHLVICNQLNCNCDKQPIEFNSVDTKNWNIFHWKTPRSFWKFLGHSASTLYSISLKSIPHTIFINAIRLWLWHFR